MWIESLKNYREGSFKISDKYLKYLKRLISEAYAANTEKRYIGTQNDALNIIEDAGLPPMALKCHPRDVREAIYCSSRIMVNGIKPTTLDANLAAVRHILRSADDFSGTGPITKLVRRGHYNVLDDIEISRAVPFTIAAHLSDILKYSSTRSPWKWYAQCCVLMGTTGMRSDTAEHLTWSKFRITWADGITAPLSLDMSDLKCAEIEYALKHGEVSGFLLGGKTKTQRDGVLYFPCLNRGHPFFGFKNSCPLRHINPGRIIWLWFKEARRRSKDRNSVFRFARSQKEALIKFIRLIYVQRGYDEKLPTLHSFRTGFRVTMQFLGACVLMVCILGRWSTKSVQSRSSEVVYFRPQPAEVFRWLCLAYSNWVETYSKEFPCGMPLQYKCFGFE